VWSTAHDIEYVLTADSTPLKHTRTLLTHAVHWVDQLGNEQLHQTVPTITTLNPSGAVLGILERGAMEEHMKADGGTLDYWQTCTCNPSDAIAYTSAKISAWWTSFGEATWADFWMGSAAPRPLRTAHATLTQTRVVYRYVRGCCWQPSVYANFVDVSLTYSSSQSHKYYRLNTHRNTQSYQQTKQTCTQQQPRVSKQVYSPKTILWQY